MAALASLYQMQAQGESPAKTVRMPAMVKASKTSTSPTQPGSAQDTPGFSSSTDATLTPVLNLVNHFLIAMPSMLDPVFGGTVIYLCEHNADGALGVIINKATDMTMDVLFDRVDLTLEISAHRAPLDKKPVMFGGPVQVERGFVLHSPHGAFSSTMKVTDDVALTTSKDVLEAVASGDGPGRILVSLGCSGWSAGQLEEEIARNGWLTVCADPAVIFDLPIEERFAAAMKLLGIDPMMLAGEAGHA
ncbi:MAG TPA: YqgE/AlgH family protein [Noviherbaspirillum sp.]|nr:YqgE/AlgH family protein [Noviherbaspirillum sp.]